jgi:hypothetical protein
MPHASTLIQRDNNGSQIEGGTQVWVISSQGGTTYSVGFEKEFVKKHLFCDPDLPTDMNAKATRLVGRVNTYGNLQGNAAEVVPVNLDAATLRFLKMKKLVLARVSQGKCSICHQSIGSHAKRCSNCGHLHKKAWANGGPCGFDTGTGACTCDAWVNSPNPGGIVAAGVLQACPGYVPNEYDLHRSAQGKANPLGGSGGACAGTNTAVLLDEIDLQTFKDVVVNAIQAENLAGWPAGQWKTGEGLSFNFGVGTVATIDSGDSLAAFNLRAKAKGIKAHVKKGVDDVYRIYHLHGTIA